MDALEAPPHAASELSLRASEDRSLRHRFGEVMIIFSAAPAHGGRTFPRLV